MKTNKKLWYCLPALLMAMLFTTTAKAQVTIGSSDEPHQGAVLDLKSNDNRGLLMPYIFLTSPTVWSPMGGYAVDGMTVFNMTASTASGLQGKGIYVWINNKWNLAVGFDDKLPGGPGSWTTFDPVPNTGEGTADNPYKNSCPGTEVVLLPKSGYTFSTPTPADAATTYLTGLKFNKTGNVEVTNGAGEKGKVYVEIVSCLNSTTPPAFSPAGETKPITVSGGNAPYSIVVTKGGNYASVSPATSNDGKFNLTFTANTGSDARVAEVTVTDNKGNAKTFTYTQAGSNAISPDKPSDWVTSDPVNAGEDGTLGKPYSNCPNTSVVLRAKTGYTFGNAVPSTAAIVSADKKTATFTETGTIEVINGSGQKGTVYAKVEPCAGNPNDYTPADLTKGEYSLGGNFCYDVYKSDGGVECGNLSERSNSFASGYEFTYTLTTNKTIKNLQFVVEDNNSIKLTTGTMTTDATAKTGKLTFVSNIKSLFASGEKKTITVHALFEDQYDQMKKVSISVMVQDCWCCGARTLKADGKTYGWLNFMCYNLGAENSGADPMSYANGANNGDLYQWGRPKDGHQKRTSSTTTTKSPTDIPNHDLFITTSSSSIDWRSGGGSHSRWGDGTTDLNMKKGANDPCPNGWKIPSQKQWALILREGFWYLNNTDELANGVDLANKWVWTGAGYKVGESLYLPAGGSRWSDGVLMYVGTWGCYASACITDTGENSQTVLMEFHEGYVQGAISMGRETYLAAGRSVRCVAE